MKNPFKRFGSYNPSQYSGPRSYNKLVIVAGIVTFIIIIVVVFESVVVVQAGHRGVVLYVGVVENRVLGEGVHFIIPLLNR
jgi:prohibitin 2